jgi:ectoine hydroxylase-related dioxygenase (phytanoyl-CoA dioxygenase family)
MINLCLSLEIAMTPSPDESSEQAYLLSDEQIADYRRDGFISLNDVIAGEPLRELRDAVAGAVASESKPIDPPPGSLPRTKTPYELIFNQKVNLWRRHPRIAPFVISKRLGTIAARLEGLPMRIWHDQALFKEPATVSNKTPWHQDAPYWPHQERRHQTTIWIALKDATVTNGCMAFVAGTHAIGVLPAVDLVNPQDIFLHAPHIKPVKPRIIELKAGSATFHNGLTFHYAGPNKSDEVREAFAIIYMPAGTRYSGERHVITDMLDLKPGQPLEGDLFPIVSNQA